VWPWIIVVVVLAAAGTAGAFFLSGGQDGGGPGSQLTFEVARGPLVVSVTESGTIQAAHQEILRSELEGRPTILTLVPEGKQVKAGELLVELDVSALVDEQVEDEIEVMTAEAELVRFQENLAVVENQAKADVKQAELDFLFAGQDLKKYKEGDHLLALREADVKITIADEELKRAETKLEGSTKLRENKFISESEFESDRLAEQKAKLNLELAEREMTLLKEYEYNRQIDQLESDLEQADLALERAKRKQAADLAEARADLKARESRLAQEKDQLADVMDQISKAKIYAPRAGLVVYATSAGDGGWRGNNEPLEEGREVREREELIYLPTANEMVAETKIHESSLEKVRLGLPVRITVDALPGKSFWGEVTRIAPLPDASSRWLNPDLKVYNTSIRVNGSSEGLRTGMSCRAEIIVENYADAVYVPVQSIVRIGGVPTAFVVRKEGPPEQREVVLGQDNNRMVVVEEGLEKGEQVLLNPPLGETGTNDSLRLEDIPADQRQQAEDAKVNPTARPAPDDAQGEQEGRPGAEASDTDGSGEVDDARAEVDAGADDGTKPAGRGRRQDQPREESE
jgi:HlyD family secretion protein